MHYNAFSGTFEQARASAPVLSSVDRYEDLPLDHTAAVGSAWRVGSASGIPLVNRHQAGVYVRSAAAGESRDSDYSFVGPALSVVVLKNQ